MKTFNLLLVLSFQVVCLNQAFAYGRDVMMKTFTISTDKQSSDPADPQAMITVKLKFRTAIANLRHIANPLARDGMLIPKIIISTPNNKRREFTLNAAASGGKMIPGWIATKTMVKSDAVDLTGFVFKCKSAEDPSCGTGNADAFRDVGGRYGYVDVNLPVDASDLGDVWLNPNNNVKHPTIKLELEQALATPRAYSKFYGYAGHITNTQSAPVWDANGRQVTITVTLFGEEGYCGGYHSPLILFFDEDRPQYTGIADFKFFGSPGLVYWPEKKSKAYFLALDRNKNGIIDSEEELFGNVVGAHDNGFEVLEKLDENHDGVIDEKDPLFSKLILWKDSTGKGQCLKKDMSSLASKGVKSISLKYKSFVRPYGARAEERAEANFTFDSKVFDKKSSGGLKEGKIIDVWFTRPSALPAK